MTANRLSTLDDVREVNKRRMCVYHPKTLLEVREVKTIRTSQVDPNELVVRTEVSVSCRYCRLANVVAETGYVGENRIVNRRDWDAYERTEIPQLFTQLRDIVINQRNLRLWTTGEDEE